LGDQRLQTKDKVSVVERLKGYINSIVEVHLMDEQVITGKLVQVDEDLLNIFLEDCTDLSGKVSPAAVIMGASISHINIVSLPAYESLDDKIYDLISKNGEMSVNEIAKILNAKPSSVSSALRRLKRSGMLPGTRKNLRQP